MEEPLTETGMVSGKDQELGCGHAEFVAPVCHPSGNGEGWVEPQTWSWGRCPGWRDAFGSHQHLNEDKNCVFGTSAPPTPPHPALGWPWGGLRKCPGDPRMNP